MFRLSLRMAISLASLEMFDEAEPVLKEILEIDAKNADAHYNLGVLYAVSTTNTEELFII